MLTSPHQIIDALAQAQPGVDAEMGHAALDEYLAMSAEERTTALAYAWQALMQTQEAASLVGMLAVHKAAMMPLDQPVMYGTEIQPHTLMFTLEYSEQTMATFKEAGLGV